MCWCCMSVFPLLFCCSISKFPKEIKLKRYLHEMTDVVIAGTKVDGAGEERTPSEQEAAVIKKGEPVWPGSRQTG